MNFPTAGVIAEGEFLVMALLGIATSVSATLSWIAFLLLVHTGYKFSGNVLDIGLCEQNPHTASGFF